MDDEDIIPDLKEEWLNPSELKERIQRQRLERESNAMDLGEQIRPPPAPNFTPRPNLQDNSLSPTSEPTATPMGDEPTQMAPPPPAPDPVTAPEVGSPSNGPRRSGRARRSPVWYCFDSQHGYPAVSAYVSLLLRNIKPYPSTHYNLRYLLALIVDPDTGLYEGMHPTALTMYPNILKATTPDPDTPTLTEALSSPHREEFLVAMRKEIQQLENHKTWRIMDRSKLPKGINVLPSTWAFKIKRFPDGRLRKFKARFCVRGDRQIEGIDYFEKYAPVVSWSTVRLVMSIALQRGWNTKQIDFENAFVQADLKEDVYIRCPPMFEPEGAMNGGEYVMKLDKSLYGLVQAPLAWYEHLQAGLTKLGFVPSEIDPGLYIGNGMVILSYVDDCLFFGPDLNKINQVIKQLKDLKYQLTEEEDVYAFLGVQVNQKGSTFKLSQSGLIKKVLKHTGMTDCNAKDTPCNQMPLGTDANGKPRQEEWNYASAVGMLMYLCSNAHPEIQYAVHQCARFTHFPKASHEEAVKRIRRYLKGVGDRRLTFGKSDSLDLNLYVDADFAGLWNYENDQDPVCVKSRTGYVITLGNSPVSWVSKLLS